MCQECELEEIKSQRFLAALLVVIPIVVVAFVVIIGCLV